MDASLTVQLSALEHFVYCPRQCGLIQVEGQWEDNRHTVRGHREHRRVDSNATTSRGQVTTLRSIPLWSERHGLSGRADAVEIDGDRVVPVEYKAGVRHGDAADVQVCAQAICLEEMLGIEIPEAAVWLGGPRRRHPVRLTDALRHRTLDVVSSVREMLHTGILPPALNDERCRECQLRHRCLPEVTNSDDRSVALAAVVVG